MFILIDFSNLLSISYFTSPFILTWVDPVALKRYAGERGEASRDGRRGPAVDGLVDDWVQTCAIFKPCHVWLSWIFMDIWMAFFGIKTSHQWIGFKENLTGRLHMKCLKKSMVSGEDFPNKTNPPILFSSDSRQFCGTSHHVSGCFFSYLHGVPSGNLT